MDVPEKPVTVVRASTVQAHEGLWKRVDATDTDVTEPASLQLRFGRRLRNFGLPAFDRVTIFAGVTDDRLVRWRRVVRMASNRISIRANLPRGRDAKPPVRVTKVRDSGVAGTGPTVQ